MLLFAPSIFPMRANANPTSVRALVAAIFLAALLPCSAMEPPAAAGLPDESGDSFTVGKITVDKRARTVRFPAKVNMAEGVLEYLLVTDKGKTHESLLATAVSPYQLNIAMLLIGARPTPEITDFPPEQLTASNLKSAPELGNIHSRKKLHFCVELCKEWFSNQRNYGGVL